MKYFVYYRSYEYDPLMDKAFDSRQDLLEFINGHAAQNPDFHTIRVIEGREIELEPVQHVTAYKIK